MLIVSISGVFRFLGISKYILTSFSIFRTVLFHDNFYNQQSKMKLKQIVPIWFQTHKHSQTNTDIQTYAPPPRQSFADSGNFPGPDQARSLFAVWATPCLCPPCNSFFQTTGMAMVSNNHFSISFKFKSETERGFGLFLLAVLKVLCDVVHPYNYN